MTICCLQSVAVSLDAYLHVHDSAIDCESKKPPIILTFDHNFGKCRPIYKIFLLSDFWGNFVHTHYKYSPPHLKYVSTLPCETRKLQLLLISMACCMWDLRIHLARYEAALIAQVWILRL